MLTISKPHPIAIHAIITRPEPYIIPSTQCYTHTELRKLSKPARVKRRRKTINITSPATHEIHLLYTTVGESIKAVYDPSNKIAMTFTIHGKTKQLIKRRPNTTIFFVDNTYYYVMIWDDAINNPMKEKDYLGHEQTVRKLERCRYPTSSLSRVDNYHKVYYLQQATAGEASLIEQATIVPF